jgi:hypothetical protein
MKSDPMKDGPLLRIVCHNVHGIYGRLLTWLGIVVAAIHAVVSARVQVQSKAGRVILGERNRSVPKGASRHGRTLAMLQKPASQPF